MKYQFAFLKSPNFWVVIFFLLAVCFICWVAVGWTEKDIKQAVFDAGLAVLISLLIYFLISWWPERRKKIALRKYLNLRYSELLDELIPEYLHACEMTCTSEEIRALKDQLHFRMFFETRVTETQNRWHVLANGLEGNRDRLTAVIVALKRFQTELDVCVTLSAVNIEQGGFERLRHLSQELKKIREQALMNDYDGIKYLCRFLWSLHTGWNFVEGYAGEDHIKASIYQGF
jgi:hypothetical protein